MSEDDRDFVEINGKRFVAPKPPPLDGGQSVSVHTTVLTGRKCKRCGKMLTASASGKDGVMPRLEEPEHTLEQCDHAIVDGIHDR